jgi:hypothetical protein
MIFLDFPPQLDQPSGDMDRKNGPRRSRLLTRRQIYGWELGGPKPAQRSRWFHAVLSSSSFREVWLGQTTTGCFHKESSQFSFASLNLWKFCSSISKERWNQLLSTSTWFGRRDLIFVKCEVHSVRIKLVPKLDHFVHLESCTRTVVHLAEEVPMDGPCFSMCMAFQMEVSHGFYMFLLHTIQLVG